MELQNLSHICDAWAGMPVKKTVEVNWNNADPSFKKYLTDTFGDQAEDVHRSMYDAVDFPPVELVPIMGLQYCEGEYAESEENGDMLYHFYPKEEEFESLPSFLRCLRDTLTTTIPDVFHGEVEVSVEESPETSEDAIQAFKALPARFRGHNKDVPKYAFQGPHGGIKKHAVSLVLRGFIVNEPQLAINLKVGLLRVLESSLGDVEHALARSEGPRQPPV
jgi:hypothetical protein